MGKFHKLSVKLCPLIFSKCVFGWIANLLHDIEGIYFVYSQYIRTSL